MTGLASDLVENAKNVGIVLTSASAASYAAGYLALRSRAHALGTDPGFTLLDQAYVFAGFRFALITLVALLAISPLLILGKAIVGATTRFVKPRGLEVLSALIAVVLAVSPWQVLGRCSLKACSLPILWRRTAWCNALSFRASWAGASWECSSSSRRRRRPP